MNKIHLFIFAALMLFCFENSLACTMANGRQEYWDCLDQARAQQEMQRLREEQERMRAEMEYNQREMRRQQEQMMQEMQRQQQMQYQMQYE